MIFLIKKNKIKIYKFNLLNKSEIKIKEKLFSYIYSNTIGKAIPKIDVKTSLCNSFAFLDAKAKVFIIIYPLPQFLQKRLQKMWH